MKFIVYTFFFFGILNNKIKNKIRVKKKNLKTKNKIFLRNKIYFFLFFIIKWNKKQKKKKLFK